MWDGGWTPSPAPGWQRQPAEQSQVWGWALHWVWRQTDLRWIYTSIVLTWILQSCNACFSTPDISPELNSSSKNRSPNPPAHYFYLQYIQGRNELSIILTWNDALSELPPSTLLHAWKSQCLMINNESKWGLRDKQWKMSPQDREPECEETNPFKVPWELLLGPW